MKRVLCGLLIAACSKGGDSAPPTPAPTSAPPAAPAAPHHEDRNDPAEAAPPLSLAVTVDGTASTWKQDLFDRVPHVTSINNGGESRDTWSLRELAHAGAGQNARVTAVIGDIKKPIDAAAWTDSSRTPIVHRTRRGTLKFRWADAAGKWGETEVKEVTGLELVAH